MKKVISAILVLLLAATLSTFLTGCGNGNWFKADNDSKEEPMAVCFVVNKHANAPEISAARFYDYVYNCSYNYGSVAAVTVEGVPRMICDYKVNPPEKHVDTTKLLPIMLKRFLHKLQRRKHLHLRQTCSPHFP